jgi:hypothetical protein
MTPIEVAIVEMLQESGPCCLDDVVTTLPNSSWGEIFAAVDRMSRDGRLVLHQRSYSAYQVSLGPQFSHSTSSRIGQATGNVMPIPHAAA